MNERTVSTRHLIRTVVMAAFIVMLAVTTAQRASANQSGPTVNERSEFQKALCEAGGGTATIDTTRTVGSGLVGVKVTCTGGLLDGMKCLNAKVGTVCTFSAPTLDQEYVLEPVGTIEQVHADPVLTPVTADETVEPGPVEDPIVEEPETVDESVDPGQAEEPATDDGAGTDDGQVIDQPETVDESVDPVVAEEPVIEDIPTAEESVDPGIVIDGSYPIVEEIVFETQEPAIAE